MKHNLKPEDVKKACEKLAASDSPVAAFAECPKCGFINQLEPETQCRYCMAKLAATTTMAFKLG